MQTPTLQTLRSFFWAHVSICVLGFVILGVAAWGWTDAFLAHRSEHAFQQKMIEQDATILDINNQIQQKDQALQQNLQDLQASEIKRKVAEDRLNALERAGAIADAHLANTRKDYNYAKSHLPRAHSHADTDAQLRALYPEGESDGGPRH